MSFVTMKNFQDRYENTVAYGDGGRLQALLDDACAMAADIIGATYADGDAVPGGIVSTICGAVRRAFENPRSLQGETIGDYTWRAGYTGVSGSANIGLFFTNSERRVMRLAAGKSAVGYVELEGMIPTTTAEQYLPVEGSDESVPWFALEDLL